MTLLLDEIFVTEPAGVDDALGTVEAVFGEVDRSNAANVTRICVCLLDGKPRIAALLSTPHSHCPIVSACAELPAPNGEVSHEPGQY